MRANDFLPNNHGTAASQSQSSPRQTAALCASRANQFAGVANSARHSDCNFAQDRTEPSSSPRLVPLRANYQMGASNVIAGHPIITFVPLTQLIWPRRERQQQIKERAPSSAACPASVMLSVHATRHRQVHWKSVRLTMEARLERRVRKCFEEKPSIH